MAQLLKGAPVAAAINEKTQDACLTLENAGITPTLATLRVGQREDDIAYEKSTVKRCEKLGVKVLQNMLPEDISQDDLMEVITKLNTDPKVHGILIFMPLPKHLDGEAVRKALSPEKDVDGITDGSLAGVFTGNGLGFAPCTAQACIEILDHYGIDCTGKHAVVVGRSLVVGKPLSMLLLAKNGTITICHSKTSDLPQMCREADILIAAVGKPSVLVKNHVSKDQILLDVGINFVDGKLCGDADFAEVEGIVSAITPVPGGVGTVTSSVLINHVVEAAKRQNP